MVLLISKFQLDGMLTVKKELARKRKFTKARKKSLREFSKGHNSANIRWTVTSKQYGLLHIMVYLLTKFHLDRM